jgi:hypothetical protein
MAKTILVPIKRNDKVEEVLPCIEKLAQPGSHVTFLTSYPVGQWQTWLRDHRITTETRQKATLAGRHLVDNYCWETQRILAEQRLSPCRETLKQKGIESSVSLYTGSLRKLVQEYEAEADVFLLLTHPQKQNPIYRVWWEMIFPYWLFTRFTFSPTPLLRSDH